jgi:hypothetical protein
MCASKLKLKFMDAPQKTTGMFIRSVAIILFFTAVIKIISFLVGHSKIFSMPNPLFNALTNGQIMGLAGLFEMLIVCILNSKVVSEKKIFAIIVLNTSFLAYRYSLFATGYTGPCPCLGGFLDWLHISNFYADKILYSLIGYMLIGSYIVLAVEFGFFTKNHVQSYGCAEHSSTANHRNDHENYS